MAYVTAVIEQITRLRSNALAVSPAALMPTGRRALAEARPSVLTLYYLFYTLYNR